MDFLSKAFEQVSDLFRTLTPGGRITVGLLLAAIVVSLMFLFNQQASGEGEYLLGGSEFTRIDIHAMEAAFATAGLGKSEVVGNKIRIPNGKKMEYLEALGAANALPENFDSIVDKVISEDSPWGSPATRKLKASHAKQKKIGMWISAFKGIESASVEYDEQKIIGFPPRIERNAVVLVSPLGNQELDERLVKAIRSTVSSAYSGLNPNDVTVTDTNGHSWSTVGEEFGLSENLYAVHQKIFEADYERKIHRLLSSIPGINVAVSAELNQELAHEIHQRKYDPKAIALQTSESSKTETSRAAAPGGRPGFNPNSTANQSAQVSTPSGNLTEITQEQNESKSITGASETVIKKPGLTPVRITASIGIPSSYYQKVWEEKNPPKEGEDPKVPTPAELLTIETDVNSKTVKQVASLLQLSTGSAAPDISSLVTVTTYQSFKPLPIESPGMGDQATTWLGSNWQTMGMIALGFFSLMMVRNMVRKTASSKMEMATAAMHQPLARLGESDFEDGSDESAAGKLRKKYVENGPNLKDELSKMVTDDLEGAANVLRNWIGDAA